MSRTRDTCEACGQRLVWAHHAKTKKPAPITAEPRDNGNALLYRAWPDGETTYVVFPPTLAGLVRSAGVPLRLNHFADCPKAERFKPGAPPELAAEDAGEPDGASDHEREAGEGGEGEQEVEAAHDDEGIDHDGSTPYQQGSLVDVRPTPGS